MDNEKFQELVLQQLGTLTEGQQDLGQRMDSMEKRLDTVDQRLDTVDQRLDKVDQRLDKVDQRLDTVDQKMDCLEKGQEMLAINVVTIRDTQKETNHKLSDLEMKIENETNQKVGALSDDRSVVHEELDSLDGKVDMLQVSVNDLSIKTLDHDSKIIELRKDIRKIK